MKWLWHRLLCYVGRHQWIYTPQGDWDAVRSCDRCGARQRLVKDFGQWFVIDRVYRPDEGGN
jgi:hypothetical protein